jgi:hypothetical protein
VILAALASQGVSKATNSCDSLSGGDYWKIMQNRDAALQIVKKSDIAGANDDGIVLHERLLYAKALWDATVSSAELPRLDMISYNL